MTYLMYRGPPESPWEKVRLILSRWNLPHRCPFPPPPLHISGPTVEWSRKVFCGIDPCSELGWPASVGSSLVPSLWCLRAVAYMGPLLCIPTQPQWDSTMPGLRWCQEHSTAELQHLVEEEDIQLWLPGSSVLVWVTGWGRCRWSCLSLGSDGPGALCYNLGVWWHLLV